jgi:hypothetical protein
MHVPRAHGCNHPLTHRALGSREQGKHAVKAETLSGLTFCATCAAACPKAGAAVGVSSVGQSFSSAAGNVKNNLSTHRRPASAGQQSCVVRRITGRHEAIAGLRTGECMIGCMQSPGSGLGMMTAAHCYPGPDLPPIHLTVAW